MNKKAKNIILIALIIVFIASLTCVYFIRQLSENMLSSSIFAITGKDFQLFTDQYNREAEYRGIKLLEYDNTNKDYAEIYYISYDYYTDPSYEYTLKVTDLNDNSILLSERSEEQIIGGVISSIKIKKQDKKDIITFSAFEKKEGNISNTNKVQVSLGKDLIRKETINQISKLKETKFLDLKFKYIDNENIYNETIQSAYSEKLTGESYSIPVQVQYGNRLIQTEYINISGKKNINNLSLEDAFNDMILITQEFGQFGLSDVYSLDIANTNWQENLIVTFDELIKLCNGQSIQKNGKTYTKNSFERYASITYKKDSNEIIGNSIKAIKYSYGDDTYNNYMFTHKDNIYYITVPTGARESEIINLFLNSLQTT